MQAEYLKYAVLIAWLIRIYKVVATLLTIIPFTVFLVKRQVGFAVFSVFITVICEKIYLFLPLLSGLIFLVVSILIRRRC